MPEILKRCVADVRKQGSSESYAYAVCISRLKKSGLIKQEGSEWVLTDKGKQHEQEKGCKQDESRK